MKITPFHYALTIRLALIGALAGLLCACSSMTLHGKPYFDEATFKTNPPRTLAILPTTDATGHPDLGPLLRRELSASISPLAYTDRESRFVDEFLATKATRLGNSPDKLPPEFMTDPKLADCVIYTQLDRVSRLYLVLYAHYRFDLNLAMVDTRTRKVIYRNRFVFYDRMGSPTFITIPIYSLYAVIGVAESSVQSLWHLRSSRLEETFEEGTRKIVKALPEPAGVAVSTSGTIRLLGVEVVKPFAVLSAGERVIVKAQGTPGCRATFSIGRTVRDLPMQENTAGSYIGVYTVRPGDDAGYAIAEIRLAAKEGNDRLDYAADKDPFAIDTTAPPRARVLSARGRFLRSGALLKLELEPEEMNQGDAKTLEYQVYRKLANEKQFQRMGMSKKLSFKDPELAPGQPAEYYVVTRDEAGNHSAPGAIRAVKIE